MTAGTMRRTMARDALLSAVGRVLAYGLSLLAAIAVARDMGPFGKGLLSLGTAIPGLVAIVGGLGLGTAATIAGRGRWLPFRAGLGALAGYGTCVGIGAVVAVGVAAALGLFSDAGTAVTVAAAAASIGGLVLSELLGGLLQGMGAVAAGMWVRQAVGIGQSVLVVMLVVVGVRDVLPILVALAAWAWTCAAAGVLAALWLAGNSGEASQPAVLPADGPEQAQEGHDGWVRRLVVVGAKTQGIWILLMLNYRLDTAMLGALRPVRDVGVYSVAVGFSEVAWFGANAFAAILLPHLASRDPRDAADLTARAVRLSMGSTTLLSVVAAVGLHVFAVPVFGRGFEASATAFVALVPGLVAMSAFKLLAIYGVARAHIRPVALLAVGGLAVNVAANVVLIPPLGSTGAALASSVSYGAISIVAAGWFLRLAGLSGRRALLPRRADLAALTEAGGRFAWGRHG